jgi:FKBP-type peptidyl-prolyl cis-trans isomerase 2
MEVIKGNTVSFHYVGTLEDGTEFDNSYDRGEPATSLIGEGKLIAGFEAALLGMKPNEKKSIVIESKDAYGDHNPKAIQHVPLTSFPEDFVAVKGKTVQGKNKNEQVFTAIITEVAEDNIILDFNHPLAGKKLNFNIEVVAVEETEVTEATETTETISDT